MVNSTQQSADPHACISVRKEQGQGTEAGIGTEHEHMSGTFSCSIFLKAQQINLISSWSRGPKLVVVPLAEA